MAIETSPAEPAIELILPPSETRQHRWLTLQNGLEVVVVSDEKCDKAGVAMDVGVGHAQDPDGLEGCAHFCEHLLFLGTKKYPEESGYAAYLSANGGASNAYTALCNTNYRFEIAPEALLGALDRFACFFTEPLFDASCTEREVNAVNSEHGKNLQSDVWRFYQMEKHLSAPTHPYSKFGTGTRETLWERPRAEGRDPRRELMEWWEREYCARRMKLVVLGKESLDTLEGWVRERFEAVPVRTEGEARLVYMERVLEEAQMGNIIFAEPVMDVRGLEITFAFPDQAEQYATKPGLYLSHFLGHGGPGSALSYLKRRGWVNSLRAGFQSGTNGFDLFKITSDLTVEGLAHYQEVIATVYRYIALLRAHPPQEYVFDDVKALSEIGFHFMEPARGSAYASELAKRMQQPVPREKVVSSQWLVERFDPQGIVEALQLLDIGKGNVAVTAKVMPAGVGPLDQIEPVYGTRYRRDKMPVEIVAAVQAGIPVPELSLPGPNAFVPKDLHVEKVEILEPRLQPTLLKTTPASRLWHKKDDTFWVPRANTFISLKSPIVNARAKNATVFRLFCDLFQDSIAEELYDVERAGLQFTVEPSTTALVIKAMGYNDKLQDLTTRMLGRLKEFVPTAERFASVKDLLHRVWISTQSDEPYTLAAYYAEYALSERVYTPLEKLAELQKLQLEDVRAFAKDLFAAFSVETLIHGNIDAKSALRFHEEIERVLGTSSTSHEDTRAERSLLLPQGTEHVWHIKVPNPNNVNSACEYFCELGDIDDDTLRCQLALFCQIATVPVYSVLRTQEQLGYSVWSGPRTSTGSMGFHILLQSEKSAEYVETRIEAFLDSLRGILEIMTEDQFATVRSGLITKQLEKPKSLSRETARYWTHMRDGYYDFERRYRDAATLTQTTKAEILDMFMKYIHPSSPLRKKLSVHLNSQYQGVKFDPQRAMPMIQAFLQKAIPVSQQKFMALVATQPGVAEIQAFARECLAEVPTLSQQDRTDLEAMVNSLGGMVTSAGEETARTRDTNKIITDIAEFKAGLDQSPPAHSHANLNSCT